jgi:hypothetical protein
VAHEALELVDARREVERQPRRLARLQPIGLELLVVVVTVAVLARRLDLEAMPLRPAVGDDERDATRADRLRLEPDAPLAERHLEAARTRIGRRRAGGDGRPSGR